MFSCPVCDREFKNHQGMVQHLEMSNCAGGAASVFRGTQMWEQSRNQQVFTTGGDGNFLEGVNVTEDAYDYSRGEYVCGMCGKGY